VCEDERVSAKIAAPRSTPRLEDLPGWELVGPGLADLAAGRETIPGELVRQASGRLRELGLDVAAEWSAADAHRLYDLVAADVGPRRAHGRYNALRRRLASFIRAGARARSR
jgi:hypothetical protein